MINKSLGFTANKQALAAALERVFFGLFLILPIIDSFNGLLNGGGNDGGLSLGIVYRAALLLVCAAIFFVYGPSRRSVLIGALVVPIFVVPHLADLISYSLEGGGTTHLSTLLKTLLPIACIETYLILSKRNSGTDDYAARLFRAWSTLFPVCFLAPLLFGMGFDTHSAGGAGYKGLFFSQNDACFALVVLYAYAMFKLSKNPSAPGVLRASLLAICILLLGLKSGYIFLVLLTSFFLATAESFSLQKKILSALSMFGIFLLICILFSDEIQQIVQRWWYLFNLFGDYASFFSSGRIDRIPAAASYLSAHYEGIAWLLFGSGFAYAPALNGYLIIEMDFADILFQYGIAGLAFFLIYYGSICFRALKANTSENYLVISFFIAMVMAALAGHVLFNAALSGMVFSAICFGLTSCTTEAAGKQLKQTPVKTCSRDALASDLEGRTSMDLVSIIVPVYNVEEYVTNCLRSILRQTYSSIEIIAVDDGSTDRSGHICDEIARSDSRLKVIHKDNGGLSDARNYGIERATGKYLTFVDGDDTVADTYVEYLVHLLEATDSDLSICGLERVVEPIVGKTVPVNSEGALLLAGDEAISKMLYAKLYSCSACGKLFRASDFADIRFPLGKNCEDMFTTWKVLAKAKQVTFGPSKCYLYLYRRGSISACEFNATHMDLFDALDEIYHKVIASKPRLEPSFDAQYVSAIGETLERNAPNDLLISRGIWERGKRARRKVVLDRNAAGRHRMMALLSYFGPTAEKACLRFYYRRIKWRSK